MVMQSYPLRALDKRLQEDWARDARKGPRVMAIKAGHVELHVRAANRRGRWVKRRGWLAGSGGDSG